MSRRSKSLPGESRQHHVTIPQAVTRRWLPQSNPATVTPTPTTVASTDVLFR